jgi:hypothetical protein
LLRRQENMVCKILDNAFLDASERKISSLSTSFVIYTVERLWPPPVGKNDSLIGVTANGNGELQYKPPSTAPIGGPFHPPTPASFSGVVPCSFTLTAEDGSTSFKKENVTVQIVAPLVAAPLGSYTISFVSVEHILKPPYRDLLYGNFTPTRCPDQPQLGSPRPNLISGLLNDSPLSPVTMYVDLP